MEIVSHCRLMSATSAGCAAIHERVLSLARQKRNNLSGKPPIKLTINIDGLDAETKRNVTHDPEPPVPLSGGTLNRLHGVNPAGAPGSGLTQ